MIENGRKILAIKVVSGENGAILQRRELAPNGQVVEIPLDAGSIQSMRVNAKAILKRLPHNVVYGEVRLPVMDQLTRKIRLSPRKTT